MCPVWSRESEHPIQRTGGCWPFASSLYNSLWSLNVVFRNFSFPLSSLSIIRWISLISYAAADYGAYFGNLCWDCGSIECFGMILKHPAFFNGETSLNKSVWMWVREYDITLPTPIKPSSANHMPMDSIDSYFPYAEYRPGVSGIFYLHVPLL